MPTGPIATVLVTCLLGIGGCAHYPVNAPLTKFDPHAGYRFENTPATEDNSDDLFIVVAFSGGGARAAAFAYGVLEELQRTRIVWQGREKSLLDEVDVISSSSGGSFTAAYYALNREKTFTDFPKCFLYAPPLGVQGHVIESIVDPLNWPLLASPTFDRVDLAAEYYDREIYRGASYADLIKQHRRPYLLLSASDVSLGTRFEFTQEQFDFLYSDLGSVSLGRAVAASSAFPVALSPVAFENYPKGADFREPAWVRNILQEVDASPRVVRRANDLVSYEDTAHRRHVRLLDGAIADYLGLRGPFDALLSPDSDFSIRRLINQHKIKKLVIISANAVRTPPIVWDTQANAPGFYDMLYFTASAPIRNNSFDTVTVMEDFLRNDELAAAHDREKIELLRHYDPALAARLPEPPEYLSYFVSLDFAKVADPALRQRLEKIRSSLSLRPDEVDDLRTAAAQLLRNSSAFQRLLHDLKP